MKNSFVVYYEILDQLEDFNDAEIGQMFKAIVNYAKDGTLPDFEGELKVAFKFIKTSIDKNNKKYEEKCEKNRQNIQKRWNTNEYDGIQSNTNYTKHTDNDNDNDNDIKNDNNNLKKENIKEKKPEPIKISKEDITSVIDYLNQNAGTHFRVVESNEKFIVARLKDYTVEDLKAVIDKKVKDWKGTEMQMYLRPETLFNATKFESYANGLGMKPKKSWEREYTKAECNSLFQSIDEIEI